MNQLKGQIGARQVGRIQDKKKELALRKEDKYKIYLQMDYGK